MNKVFTIIFTFILFDSHFVNADTVYKKIQKNGTVEYSDKLSSKAVKVNLPPANVQLFVVPEIASTLPKNPSRLTPQIKIISPKNNASIRSNGGEFSVVVKENKPTTQSYLVQLFINGDPYSTPQKEFVFKLKNIDRGAIKISVQLQSTDGDVLANSQEITLYIHKASVIHK